MISVNLTDRQGEELQLGDVVLKHRPNERLKYLGVLCFDEKRYVFYLSNMDEELRDVDSFPGLTWERTERLFRFDECPSIKKELGSIKLDRKQKLEKILDPYYDILLVS